MAYVPNSQSVIAFQSDPTKLVGTVSVVGMDFGNSSVIVKGSITAIQGTNPWQVNVPTPSYISYQAAGSIMAISGSFSAGNTSVNAFQGGPWSVATLQGTNPWVISNPSVTAFQGGTWATSIVGVAQVGGSVLVHTANNSVITVLTNSSVAVLQGTDPWKVNVPTPSYIAYQLAGSLLGVSGSFSGGNSSVELLSTSASIAVLVNRMLQGSASVVVNNILTGNSSVQLINGVGVIGSVAVLQGTSPWLINVPSPSTIAYQLAGSILAVSGSFSGGNSSVTLLGGGTVYLEKNATTASVLGIPVLFKIDETNSVLSAVSPQSPFPVRGSVTALQGTNPWRVDAAGGSVTQVRTDNASVVAVLSNSSVAVLQGTSPWLITGSVMATGNTSVTAFQGGAWSTSMVGGPMQVASILGTYQEKAAAGNASVIGHAMLFKNNTTTSTLSTVSILDPLPVQGSVMTLQGTNPWQVNMPSPSVLVITPAGSVQAVRMDNASVVAVLALSSVATLQGTNPWIVNVPTPSYLSIQPSGSVINANISGSVAVRLLASSVSALQGTEPWVIQSIVGTFAEDAAHTTADKGVFSLNVRNDTMSSVTSADGDYSALSTGPVGEAIVANSPITKWVSGRTSVMLGTSVQVLAAPGTSIFTYITGINVINESPNAARVTITQGLGAVPASMVTWLIAPGGGGSNSTYPNPLRILDNLGVSASINSAVASVYVTITGFTAKV